MENGKKERAIYINCGRSVWRKEGEGTCPECLVPNALTESLLETEPKKKVVPLSAVKPMGSATIKLSTYCDLGAVQENQLTRQTSILVHGPAGAGKTSAVLELLAVAAASSKSRALFVSSESTPEMVANLAQRIELDTQNIDVAQVDTLEEAEDLVRENSIVAIDSVSDLFSRTKITPGNIARTLVKAISKRSVLVLIGHDTADQKLKGGSDLPHFVDAVISVTKEKVAVEKSRLPHVESLERIKKQPARPRPSRPVRPLHLVALREE